MIHNITIASSKLAGLDGVASFWNAILPEFTNIESINVTHLGIGGHGKNILGPIRDQWNFKKMINIELDLVILNPSLGFRSFVRDALFAMQLRKRKVPFVVFFHGWDLEFEKKVSAYYRKFFMNSYGKAKIIFVLSNDFKMTIREWGYKGEIIIETTTVNNNLLIHNNFEQDLIDVNYKDKIRILFLARLVKEKGVYETITAFKKLKETYQNIELIMAGDGQEYAKLEVMVKNEDDIIMTGFVSGKKKIDLLRKCQVYCLPSYTEGLPISVLEAMAFGLPVVTTAVGGLKDFFQEGKMGYFVEAKNAKHLTEKLAYLISDRNARNSMGQYNFNYANENLMSPVVAKRLFNHLKKLLH